jgi:hypothetical protein
MTIDRVLFLCLTMFLAAAPLGRPWAPRAEQPALPDPEDVFVIAVKPQARQLPEHFTPETLLGALPALKPAYLVEPIGGKIWSQSGVIVLKSGAVLFWRSYKDEVIAVETGGPPILYAVDP